MNANRLSASKSLSPLVFSASEANRKSGTEMKRRWIGQVLREMQQANETMGRQRRNDTHRVTRSAKKSPSA